MIKVSGIITTPPEEFSTPLQRRVYETLGELSVPYFRVDTDEAITMEDCRAIDERLGTKIVKTLFLCNRQQTQFYLFVTAGDKPFRSKDFSAAMGVSRVSFATAEQLLDVAGTRVGAATLFSALLESSRAVGIVIDREVLSSEWYGCSDGTTTGYMKLRTQDMIGKVLPRAGRTPSVIDVPRR